MKQAVNTILTYHHLLSWCSVRTHVQQLQSNIIFIWSVSGHLMNESPAKYSSACSQLCLSAIWCWAGCVQSDYQSFFFCRKQLPVAARNDCMKVFWVNYNSKILGQTAKQWDETHCEASAGLWGAAELDHTFLSLTHHLIYCYADYKHFKVFLWKSFKKHCILHVQHQTVGRHS